MMPTVETQISQNSIMWLSEKALDWEATNFSVSSTEPQKIFRSYELLQHAELIITNSTNDFQLADEISNLKRALNQRLKYIDELYNVSAAFPKNFGFLECLHELDLARPFVIKQLNKVRNDIEHNDAMPPAYIRCLELLDITWYLLKSTDSICSSRRSCFECVYGINRFGESEYFLSVKLHEMNKCEIEFSGRLPSSYISRKEQAGYFQFHCECEKNK